MHYLKHSLVSESKREYQKSEETRLKSRIRHENLEDLKSKFKAQMKL